jgi:hypothetical protein
MLYSQQHILMCNFSGPDRRFDVPYSSAPTAAPMSAHSYMVSPNRKPTPAGKLKVGFL